MTHTGDHMYPLAIYLLALGASSVLVAAILAIAIGRLSQGGSS